MSSKETKELAAEYVTEYLKNQLKYRKTGCFTTKIGEDKLNCIECPQCDGWLEYDEGKWDCLDGCGYVLKKDGLCPPSPEEISDLIEQREKRDRMIAVHDCLIKNCPELDEMLFGDLDYPPFNQPYYLLGQINKKASIQNESRPL